MAACEILSIENHHREKKNRKEHVHSGSLKRDLFGSASAVERRLLKFDVFLICSKIWLIDR